jgi:Fe-S-cluster containining protein
VSRAGQRLLIPEWLRFSCTGCGRCCRRGWVIHFPAADKERLAAHPWTDSQTDPGAAQSLPLFVRQGRSWRFGLDGEGACRFLDSRARCRIHGELGYEAKVLACRLYPLYFVHTDDGVRVGAHFSCPAVASRTGPPLREDPEGLRALLADVERESPPAEVDPRGPVFSGSARIGWSALAALESALDRILAEEKTPLLRRVLGCASLLDRLDESLAGTAAEEAAPFDELLAHHERAALDAARNAGLKRARLGPMERILLRTLCGLSSEMAVQGLLAPGFGARQRARLARLGVAWRFLLERGVCRIGTREVRLERAREAAGFPLPSGAESILALYLRTRFATRAYFGSEGWGMGVLHGARFLLSLYAVTLWLARLHAGATADEAERAAGEEDLAAAVISVDHAYGHLATLRLPLVRHLVGTLVRPGWVQKAALYASL